MTKLTLRFRWTLVEERKTEEWPSLSCFVSKLCWTLRRREVTRSDQLQDKDNWNVTLKLEQSTQLGKMVFTVRKCGRCRSCSTTCRMWCSRSICTIWVVMLHANNVFLAHHNQNSNEDYYDDDYDDNNRNDDRRDSWSFFWFKKSNAITKIIITMVLVCIITSGIPSAGIVTVDVSPTTQH